MGYVEGCRAEKLPWPDAHKRSMRQSGNACLSDLTPSSVTQVPERTRTLRFVNRHKWARPESATAVSERSKFSTFVNRSNESNPHQ